MALRSSKLVAVLFAGTMLAACNGVLDSSIPKHQKPVPASLTKKMKAKGMSLGAPILLRIYKEENVMEIWKQDHTKRYALLNTYEICKWSGKLGPKHKEGDKQAPEGFYHVTPGLMNPNSSYHLSFNMGFPNTYDRANDRTGSYLMIHGACSSAGCYSMTDEYVEEIYALAREAFKGGQRAFQIQAFPFRMTAENLAKNVGHPDFEFWKMLKEGSDHFEVTRKQPKVDVCEKRYVFNRYADEGERFNSRQICPPAKMPRSLALAFNEKQNKDETVFNKVLKRNASSLFAKEPNNILALSASIKATPTEGVLEIMQPKPVAATASSATANEETKPSAETGSETSPTAQRDANPISAEVVGSDASANGVAEESSELSPVSAVPEQAPRVSPAS